MQLPIIKNTQKKREPQLISLGGVNYTDVAKEGELRQSLNLSSERYPYISTRPGRSLVNSFARPTALYAWNGLVYVDGTDLYYNGEIVGTVTEGAKQFAVINTKLVIWPDKMYLDLTNNEFKSLEVSLTSPANSAVFTVNSLTMDIVPVTGTGQQQYSWTSASPAPTVKVYTSVSWTEGGGWTRTGGTEKLVYDIAQGDIIIPAKVVSSGAYIIGVKSGSTFPTENNDGVYYEITAAGVSLGGEYRWEEWTAYYVVVDGQAFAGPVEFRGYVYSTNINAYNSYGIYGNYWYQNRAISVSTSGSATFLYDIHSGAEGELFTDFLKAGDVVAISGCTTIPANNVATPLTDTAKQATILSVTNDKLTFTANIFTAGSEAGAVTVTKVVPNLAYICEHKNRLWGVLGQTMFASALGDPANFYRFSNLSTDSYQAAVSSRGDFTGCIGLSESVVFFKEDMIYKMLGDYPAEFVRYEYSFPGLQSGCNKSLQIINELLFYKSRNGIYAYNGGGEPSLVSYPLGINKHLGAVAGTDGLKYYVSMMDDTGTWGLYVYDTLRRQWLKEDDTHAVDFAYQNGQLYFLDIGNGKILSTSGASTEDVEWIAEFAEFNETVLNKKGYSKLTIRAELAQTATLKVETSIDGAPYKQVFITHNEATKTVVIPLRPVRCDGFRVKLSGSGQCAIKSMAREFTLGSEN